jgi:hypothetical protein
MPKDYNNMPSIDEAALWERTSTRGLNYLSGTVTIEGQEYKISLFKNENKENGDNRPAWSFKQNKEIK